MIWKFVLLFILFLGCAEKKERLIKVIIIKNGVSVEMVMPYDSVFVNSVKDSIIIKEYEN